MVGVGGNAPLVSFRFYLVTTALQAADRNNTRYVKMVAGPGNAPGLQGYGPRVEPSRPALYEKNWSRRRDSHSLSRTSKVRGSASSPSARVKFKLEKWRRRRDLHPPHAACKAASPLWNMLPLSEK